MLGDKIGIFPILYVEVNTHLLSTRMHTLTHKRHELQAGVATAARRRRRFRRRFAAIINMTRFCSAVRIICIFQQRRDLMVNRGNAAAVPPAPRLAEWIEFKCCSDEVAAET